LPILFSPADILLAWTRTTTDEPWVVHRVGGSGSVGCFPTDCSLYTFGVGDNLGCFHLARMATAMILASGGDGDEPVFPGSSRLYSSVLAGSGEER